MRKKQYIGLLIVLAAIIVAFLGVKGGKAYHEKKVAEEEAAAIVYVDQFDADDVVAFSYQYLDETYQFQKTDDTWYYVNDESISLDQDAVQNIVDTMSNMSANTVIEDADPSEYGFDDPTQVFHYELSDGTSVDITFGMGNKVTTGYYVQPDGDSNIYLVDATYSSGALSTSIDTLTAEEDAESLSE